MHPFDIVVPCHNYGRYLMECVKSILVQDGCSVRILIIDDASSDGSVDVAQDLAARDPRIELIAHADNKGHIATYNEGIAWARQKYFLLLSADDVLAPGALKRAADLLETNAGVAFVCGKANEFRGDIPPSALVDSTPSWVVPGRRFIADICANPINPVATATAVVRTSVQKRVGYYKDELPHAGDLEMWLRCAACGDVGKIEVVQAYRRLHDSNLSALYAADGMMFDFIQRYDAFRLFFAEHGLDLHDGKRLAALANHQLANQIVDEAVIQLRHRRVRSALRLMHFAYRVAPGMFLTIRLIWRLARRFLLGIKRRLSARSRRDIR
jgi:glycosyltransferase involved in cell wall biosynthesis